METDSRKQGRFLGTSKAGFGSVFAAEGPHLYKCCVCDTLAEVLDQKGPEQICCGRAMTPMLGRSTGMGEHIHLPVLSWCDGSIDISVGRQRHPMSNNHHIQWIEFVAEGQSHRRFLKVGQPPEVTFGIQSDCGIVRAFCNRDGLWEAVFTRGKEGAGPRQGAIAVAGPYH